MSQVQLATKVEEKVKKALESVCDRYGILMSHFIEDAIIDKIEEMEDLEDIRKLRHESYRPLKDVLKDLRETWRRTK